MTTDWSSTGYALHSNTNLCTAEPYAQPAHYTKIPPTPQHYSPPAQTGSPTTPSFSHLHPYNISYLLVFKGDIPVTLTNFVIRDIVNWKHYQLYAPSTQRSVWSISIVQPTRHTIVLRLLNITLHVSDGLSVHHHESKTVHTASGTCHTRSLTACQREQDETLVPSRAH